jgi:hypothetical protein
MGGNAIKNHETIRLNKPEFLALEADVLGKLQATYPDKKIKSLVYYSEKNDFGDLDILIESPQPNAKDLDKTLYEFGTKEIYHNNHFVSFEYQKFQVDLIFVSPEQFDFADFYFSYNDLNNLVGRIANNFGLKFGWQGLWYPLKNYETDGNGEVLISLDRRKTYDFLGMDYDRYLKGFNNLEEIFQFVVSSKYFSKKIFAYENLKHANRLRNRKRRTYQSFLDWLGSYHSKKQYKFNEDKKVYLRKVKKAFPEAQLSHHIALYKTKKRRLKKIRHRFNGKLLMQWIPAIKPGKELGSFIKRYKDTKEDFDQFILASGSRRIVKRDVVAFYKSGDSED